MICRRGCALTDCSSIPPRLKCCGVHLHGVSIRSRPRQCISAICMCCRYHLLETSGLSRRPTSPWLLTSLLPYEHVSWHFGRYAACGVLWQRTLCWCCFVHSSSAKLTVIAHYWPGSLCHSLIDCSQCSTLPLVSCSRQDGQNMWLHFSVTFIGWRSWKVQVLCVLTHRCLHGTAPPYLTETIQRTSDMSARRHLWSAATPTLVVPLTRRSTLGDWAFPVAAARVSNSLPSLLRAVQSLTTFRRRLKAERFT